VLKVDGMGKFPCRIGVKYPRCVWRIHQERDGGCRVATSLAPTWVIPAQRVAKRRVCQRAKMQRPRVGPMSMWSWYQLVLQGADFHLCECEHFALQHDWETGECYGTGPVRCECRTYRHMPDD
jgi:hypothetical protein